MRSKALKSDYKCCDDRNWFIEKLVSIYNDVRWFFVKPYRQLKKIYGWYKNVFKNDYDFDGHCLYAIIEYKLRRVEKVLKNGHAIQEPKDMKALRIAIKLSKKLKEDKYDEKSYDRHEVVWGETRHWTNPTDKDGNYWRMYSSRVKVKSKEDEEKEREDYWKSIQLQEKLRERDERNLYSILQKYLRSWWD
jgi:hypothetical protein